MIIGHGIDLVDARRIEKLMTLYPERFRSKYFTDAELAQGETVKDPRARILYFAKRFAAKEAAAKALGTGFRQGLKMKDIEIGRHEKTRSPILSLSGAASKRLANLLPEGAESALHVSLSDDPPYAMASVIIEAR